ALRLRLDADVEPDGRVEGGDLVDEDGGELVVEGVAVGGGLEVAALLAVAGDRGGHALDELADGGLALGGPEAAVEVLLDDDVRRRLRPRLRDLDVLLLEDRLALLRRDRRGAQLPLDRVVRRDGRVRIDPCERQAAQGACRGSRCFLLRLRLDRLPNPDTFIRRAHPALLLPPTEANAPPIIRTPWSPSVLPCDGEELPAL